MQGSGGSRGLFVHLLAGAALGAVVVLMVWIFSGGRPFGEVVGTSDVSAPTTASVKQTDVQKRLSAPAGAAAQLESEPPDLGAASKKGRGDSLQFRKETAARPPKAKAKAKAERIAAAKAKARSRARKRRLVRVVAPPSEEGSGGDALPVAAVPSPAPAGTPAPAAAPPPPKPAKPRTPTYSVGAGEG